MDMSRIPETSTRSGSVRTRGFTVNDGDYRECPAATYVDVHTWIHDSEPDDASVVRTRFNGKTQPWFHIKPFIAHGLLLLVSGVLLVASAKPVDKRTAAEGLTSHPTRTISHENAWHYRYPGGYENARTYRF